MTNRKLNHERNKKFKPKSKTQHFTKEKVGQSTWIITYHHKKAKQ